MKKPDRILKGDVVAVVLAQAECHTPLFIGTARYDATETTTNEAEFADTYFLDDGNMKAKKISYKKFVKSYNFGFFRSTMLENRAENRGYVWVWTVIPSKTFREA